MPSFLGAISEGLGTSTILSWDVSTSGLTVFAAQSSETEADGHQGQITVTAVTDNGGRITWTKDFTAAESVGVSFVPKSDYLLVHWYQTRGSSEDILHTENGSQRADSGRYASIDDSENSSILKVGHLTPFTTHYILVLNHQCNLFPDNFCAH